MTGPASFTGAAALLRVLRSQRQAATRSDARDRRTRTRTPRHGRSMRSVGTWVLPLPSVIRSDGLLNWLNGTTATSTSAPWTGCPQVSVTCTFTLTVVVDPATGFGAMVN